LEIGINENYNKSLLGLRF